MTTVTCTYVDHCFSDYLSDLTGILVGIPGTGQTAAEIAAEAAEEALDDDDMPEGVTAAELTALALDELDDTARFWPVDAHGNELTDGSLASNADDEQPCFWFRFTVEGS